jgi:putative intracellular protease/amidase
VRPVQAQAGFTALPNHAFQDRLAMDAFLIPGGFGTRQEMHNRRLHEFVQSLPEATLLTSATAPTCQSARCIASPVPNRVSTTPIVRKPHAV